MWTINAREGFVRGVSSGREGTVRPLRVVRKSQREADYLARISRHLLRLGQEVNTYKMGNMRDHQLTINVATE